MATSTRPKPKTKPKTPTRGRPRGRPHEPSEGRVDDPDARLRARARGPEGARNREASSGAFGDIDDRLTKLEEGGGQRKAPAASASSPSRALSLSRPTSVPSTTAPMLVELIVVTVDEILGHHRPPIPSRVGVVVVLFGGLGLVGGSAAPAAAALAWGLVIASVYSTSSPSGTSTPLRALATVGDFISGKYATKSKGK